MFLPCSLLIQDGFSEDNWKEAGEAVAAAKVRKVCMWFNDSSTQRSRAVDTISAGLARNKFIREIILRQVPEEIIKRTRQTLKTNSGVTHVVMIYF